MDSPPPHLGRKLISITHSFKPLEQKDGKLTPLVTITVGVRGAIREPSMQAFKNLNISPQEIEKLMKYLTYIVLNKRKLDNKQAPVDPPQDVDSLQ